MSVQYLVGVPLGVRDHADAAPRRLQSVSLARRHLLLWRTERTQPGGAPGAQGAEPAGDRPGDRRRRGHRRQPLGRARTHIVRASSCLLFPTFGYKILCVCICNTIVKVGR